MVFTTAGGGANQLDTGYNIDNSLRFNDGDSPSLSRTPSSAGNRKIWTWSGWVKRSTLGTFQFIFDATVDTNDATDNQDRLYFSDSNYLIYQRLYDAGTTTTFQTNQVFRDVSAWYHIVLALDTTDATSTNRVKIYVNGEQITSFSTSDYPPQNYETEINNNVAHYLGNRGLTSSLYFDGYLAETYFIDGQQLAPSDFGETNDNGVWIPKAYEGTYGTNGFFLKFADSSDGGVDSSGNGNDFTATNLTAQDNTTDTPTNNFATMNALINSNGTLSEGNVKYTTSNSTNNYGYRLSTIGVASGKWYCEVKYTSSSNQAIIGIRSRLATDVIHKLGYYDDDFGIYTDGRKITNNTLSSYGTSWTNGDIIGILLDLDSNKLYFAKNGTIMNGGTGIDITDASSTTTGFYFISATEWNSSGNGTFEFNFGNPSFSISSGNTDGLYGNFEYSVSTGYSAICTKRLAEYG